MSKKHPKKGNMRSTAKPKQQVKKPAPVQVKKDNTTRNLVFSMIALVLVVGVAFTIITSATPSFASPQGTDKQSGYAVTYKATSETAPVIDIWEDFQCPACKNFEQTNSEYLTSLIKERKATVKYHMLSFLGQDSVRAANAAGCAADQGKFDLFHANLYKEQKGENTNTFSNANLLKFAQDVGITDPAFATCVSSNKYLGWLNNTSKKATKAKINSTPTVFVNGKELDKKTQYYDAAAFKKAVGR